MDLYVSDTTENYYGSIALTNETGNAGLPRRWWKGFRRNRGNWPCHAIAAATCLPWATPNEGMTELGRSRRG